MRLFVRMVVRRERANNGTAVFAEALPNERRTETRCQRNWVCYQLENYREQRVLVPDTFCSAQPVDDDEAYGKKAGEQKTK